MLLQRLAAVGHVVVLQQAVQPEGVSAAIALEVVLARVATQVLLEVLGAAEALKADGAGEVVDAAVPVEVVAEAGLGAEALAALRADVGLEASGRGRCGARVNGEVVDGAVRQVTETADRIMRRVMEAAAAGDLEAPHAPVTDSCLNCHQPHAGGQEALLTMPKSELCAQ